MKGQAYISHEHRFVALWSPKCASTSVANWFINGFVSNCYDKSKFTRKMLHSEGYTCDANEAQWYCFSKGYTSAFYSRNPYSRSVSAFLNKFYVKHQKVISSFEKLEPFARDFINDYNSYRVYDSTNYNISFIQYLEFVSYLILEKKSIDHHWDRQVPRFDGFKLVPDFIVKQESFDQDIKNLNAYFDLPDFVTIKRNSTTYSNDYILSDSDFSHASNFECRKQKIALKYNNLINSQSASLIKRIYSIDFEYFKYDKDSF